MTVPMPRQGPDPEPTRRVDARPLWSGGAATAVVAALIALVGILVCRWLFKVPILSPRREGAWGCATHM
jgi:fatty acid desaturase